MPRDRGLSMVVMACFLVGPVSALSLPAEADPIQGGLKAWVTAPGVERPMPKRAGPGRGRTLGLLEERPALDEVITLQTPAGPARVPYGYLLARPNRGFLATGRYRFHFGFWMPSGRMPTEEINILSWLPDEPASRDPLRHEYFVSFGLMVAPGVERSGDVSPGLPSDQRLSNIFSIIGRDNFTYEVGPRMTRAVPKPGTSAFELYYSTPDGAGGFLPFDVRCFVQSRAEADSICDGRVLFPFFGLFSAVRIRREAVHLLPDALDTAARLLAAWLGKDRAEPVP